MSRILITGATGYVGGALAREFARAGDDVRVLVRPASDLRKLPAEITRDKIVVHDGTTESLLRNLSAVSPEVVIHAAALVSGEHSAETVEPMVRSNVLLGVQLLEAMVDSGAKRFINTGTFWQNSGSDWALPNSLYAATKQAFQELLDLYSRKRGIAAVTLKLYDVYGPDDPRRKLFSYLRAAARTGEPLELTPGDQRLDLVYIADVVAAYRTAARALFRGATGHEVYAVRSGKTHSLKEIVALYQSVTGRTFPAKWGARPYRETDIMAPWEGPILPDWSARVSLEEGIRKLLASESSA